MLWIGLILGLSSIPLLALCLPVQIRLKARFGGGEPASGAGSVGLLAGGVGARVVVRSGRTVLVPTLFGVGLWRFRMGEAGRKRGRSAEARKPRDRRKRDEGGPKGPWRRRIRLLGARVKYYRSMAGRLRRPALRFVRRLRRAFRVGRVFGRVAFGFQDPAVTGQVYGGWEALRRLLPPRVDLHLEPEWGGAAVAGELEVRVSICLILLLRACAALACRIAVVWFTEGRARRRALRRLEQTGVAAA